MTMIVGASVVLAILEVKAVVMMVLLVLIVVVRVVVDIARCLWLPGIPGMDSR